MNNEKKGQKGGRGRGVMADSEEGRGRTERREEGTKQRRWKGRRKSPDGKKGRDMGPMDGEGRGEKEEEKCLRKVTEAV